MTIMQREYHFYRRSGNHNLSGVCILEIQSNSSDTDFSAVLFSNNVHETKDDFKKYLKGDDNCDICNIHYQYCDYNESQSLINAKVRDGYQLDSRPIGLDFSPHRPYKRSTPISSTNISRGVWQ